MPRPLGSRIGRLRTRRIRRERNEEVEGIGNITVCFRFARVVGWWGWVMIVDERMDGMADGLMDDGCFEGVGSVGMNGHT